MAPGDGRQQAWREAVRAFGLVAAALETPAPKLLADLAAPEEGLRNLEREPPLAYFSPFGTLPKDIVYGRGEPVHPSAGATRTPERFTEREATRFDAGWAETPGGAEDLPRAASPEARLPTFSFRRRDRDVREGSMDGDTTRVHFHVPGAAPEDPTQEGPVNSSYPVPSIPERPELTYVRGNEDFAEGALQPADPMALLDDLAEEALGAVKSQARGVPAHPANTPPQAIRSRGPGRKAYGGETVAPVYPPAEHSLVYEDWDSEGQPPAVDHGGRWEEGLVAAKGLRKAEPGNGGVTALIDSLTEDLFSSPIRTPGEPMAPNRSTLAPPDSAFDEPASGLPPGAETSDTDEGVLERVPEQYVDPEAFAALVNDVLVRQARRHGVDLS